MSHNVQGDRPGSFSSGIITDQFKETFLKKSFLSRRNKALLISLIYGLFLGSGAHANGDQLKPKLEQRIIKFPDQSIGPLNVMPSRSNPDDSWMMYGFGKQVGTAHGTVTLKLAPGALVMLDANRRVFENPLLLKEVSPDGIDILKLGFISMDDNEDHYLERAISYVDNLKGLRALFLDRSEANDADVSKLKSMKHLRVINFFLTGIDGSCFRGLGAFPELEEIDAPLCKIDQRHIVDLARIAKLKHLDLSHTGMNLVGARALAKIPNLTVLSLGNNERFDDQCLKFLSSLPHLRYLDLRGTKVTVNGIEAIHNLGLKRLYLPSTFEHQAKKLATLFPKALITVERNSAPSASKEEQMMYRPLR